MSRVLLIEDHVSFSDSFALMLEKESDLEVVGRAGSVEEARGILDIEAEVAIVDLGLPDGNGAEVIWELRKVKPGIKTLVLTSSIEREEIARAIEAGAAGFMHKSSRVSEVVDAVRRLLAGEALMPADETIELLLLAARKREEWRQHQMAIMKLTPREVQVLEALAEGLDSEAIARLLKITIETERTHIVNILGKLKAHSRLEAVIIAARHGVVEIPSPSVSCR